MRTILTLLLVIGMMTTASAQLQLVSQNYSLSQWDPSKSKYGPDHDYTGKNYITWKDGEITIVCPNCKKNKFVYTVTENLGRRNYDSEFYGVEYKAISIPDGYDTRVMLGKTADGEIVNMSIRYNNILVIYKNLSDY
jgi:hypothetical protein